MNTRTPLFVLQTLEDCFIFINKSTLLMITTKVYLDNSRRQFIDGCASTISAILTFDPVTFVT